ncbi:hypothetical protein LTR78_000986 [Recurvomyces mirabilis]|uniref:Uncharacterized protein n=1 Tax=Recurvomyces mirabilis TaxID=574656 RepID=A0AAE0WXI8_9PEZI|nr:hypothetical protein LTR78_000986 [Recurvomyces mirabilis]KAK4570243.1 hypothetical protein LTR86_002323 [Recurvomyces mirabilis]KAK5158958.1 hypothetical protein LTS14_003066 [Recurvomyces mirabilis]
MRGGKSKKADDATSSLNELAGVNPGKGAATTPGTSVSGAQQVQNMQTGTADHLDMGFRKS